MEQIRNILKIHYHIDTEDIIAQPGGWTALAYKVTRDGQAWFLKAFEKNRPSIRVWTARIDHYVPIMLWLLDHTGLCGKIPVPLLTISGACQCEDETRIYMVYEYINGQTIGDGKLSHEQILYLSGIVAELHSYGAEIPVETDTIREDFDISFIQKLRGYMEEDGIVFPEDLRTMVEPHRKTLSRLSDTLASLSEILKAGNPQMVLCHMDVHNWNVMQNGDQLYLIDWEGIRLAPPEADLIFFTDKPYYPVFLETYKKSHPDFVINKKALSFYLIRRYLDDIWAWLEQLLHDEQDDRERAKSMDFLGRNLGGMDGYDDLHGEFDGKFCKPWIPFSS